MFAKDGLFGWVKHGLSRGVEAKVKTSKVRFVLRQPALKAVNCWRGKRQPIHTHPTYLIGVLGAVNIIALVCFFVRKSKQNRESQQQPTHVVFP